MSGGGPVGGGKGDVEYAEVARAESERGELVLRARREAGRPEVLELRANGVFVMDTEVTSTEVALATTVLSHVSHPRSVVVGGLGLGFTLEAVLADPRVEQVRVVEIEPALIGWMRDGTIRHGPRVLADQRVTVVNADLAMAVAEARERHDVVLLDVDNGPGYLVHESNGSLYESPFLAQVRDLLTEDGVVAVWSADRAPDLERSLREVFAHVEVRGLPVSLQGRDETYWLHLARTLASADTDHPAGPHDHARDH